MNWISRIAAYPILERELNHRIDERDLIILEQQERIAALEDRLFMRFGLPVKGEDIKIGKPASVPPYRSGRRRLRDMVQTPLVANEKLSPEEEKQILESLTQ